MSPEILPARPERFSDDAFLDHLRTLGDARADRSVAELLEEHGAGAVSRIFRTLDAVEETLPEGTPRAFVTFFDEARELAFPVDAERVARGRQAFFDHAFPAALVLLARSLPAGYAAPCLSRILHMTGNLDRHPYRRLLGVLQLIVEVGSEEDFSGPGAARVAAVKLRLLHAGIRHLTHEHLPDYEARYGVPVNLEDMLATIMGFSYLVVDGLKQLDVGLSEEAAEDYYYIWAIFARLMGIHPPGEPGSDAYVPRDLTEAARFYAAYSRRQFVGARDNPEGVTLARHNLEMLRDMLPRTARRLGGGLIPRIYMWDLLGPEAARRVGIRPLPGHALLGAVLLRLPHLWLRLAGALDPSGHLHRDLARATFQGLIDRRFGGEVEWVVPTNLDDLARLVDTGNA